MRIVIAPDKFKGSLSAPDVARHLEEGLQAASASRGRVPWRYSGFPWPTAAKAPWMPPSAPASPAGAPWSAAPPASRSGGVCGPRPGGSHRDGGGLRARRPAALRWRRHGILAAGWRRRPGLRHRQGGHQPGHRRTHPGRAGRRLPADHLGRRRQRQHRRRRRGPAGTRRQTPRRRRQRTPAGGAALADLAASTSPASNPGWTRPALSWPATWTTPCWAPRAPRRSSARRRAPHPRTSASLDAALANFVEVLAREIGPAGAERPRTHRAPERPAASATRPSRSWPRRAGRASTSCLNSPNWPTGWPAPTW